MGPLGFGAALCGVAKHLPQIRCCNLESSFLHMVSLFKLCAGNERFHPHGDELCTDNTSWAKPKGSLRF
jgi:hypothetical protein